MLAGSAILVMSAAGCTGTTDTEAEPSTPTETPAPVNADSASPLPVAPTSTPAATSGALTAALLPPPGELGAGWRLRVEGSDEEDGIGNGTAYQERDPLEVVDTVLPMGCERRSSSSVPVNVLQSTYALSREGAYAVALRLRFDSPTEAAKFADTLREDLRICRDQPDDPYSGAPAPVLDVSTGDSSYSSGYQLVGESGVWIKAVQVDGSDVLTLDSDAPPATVNWPALGYQSP